MNNEPDVLDYPALKRFVEEHGLAPEEVQQLLEHHQVDPQLISELIHLASVRFRTLDLWGQKAEYLEAIQSLLANAAEVEL